MTISIKNRSFCLAAMLTVFASFSFGQKKPVQTQNSFIAKRTVSWTTLGKDENDSMPIGNGQFGANVWTEQNGDLLLLLSSPDTWTETGKLVKLGRVRVKLSPNPFVGATDLTQSLKVESGTIEIKKGADILTVWVDASNPVLHVNGKFASPVKVDATLESWRKTQPITAFKPTDHTRIMTGDVGPKADPDILFPADRNQLTWCHFNVSSYFPYLLKQEHLESMLGKTTDPLLHRCFGAVVSGTGLVKTGDNTLSSKTAAKTTHLQVMANIYGRYNSPSEWRSATDRKFLTLSKLNIDNSYRQHKLWWQNFWNRSWVNVSGSAEADAVSQGYAMQRYMVACSSRGELPTKFNGGIFTVGHDLPDTTRQTNNNHDADYRAWGDSYWNQNNRLLYWPLIASGDINLIKPWFSMYINALPLAKAKDRIYNQQDGASYPETMHFWGLSNLADFGHNNPSNQIESRWQRYHVQGTLEVIAQMLDVYDHQSNAKFARDTIVPFADAIVKFYNQHWQRDANGKILMAPMQSLETYQLTAVNPTPDIAGLMSVIPRLIALPKNLTTATQRDAWAKTLHDLPAIPLGKTAKGKIPPLGVGDADGTPVILPAEKYGNPGNSENPELYVAFPYRLYTVDKPNLALAVNTFNARKSPQNTCWGQDGTQAAVLGLTPVAKKAAIAEFTNYGDQRFKWFWRPDHDWIPDLDNGGDGMITLQNMVMQTEGKKILITPAWPQDWTADFKLHAPGNTTIQGHVENGKVSNLKVTPGARLKDVVVVKAS